MGIRRGRRREPDGAPSWSPAPRTRTYRFRTAPSPIPALLAAPVRPQQCEDDACVADDYSAVEGRACVAVVARVEGPAEEEEPKHRPNDTPQRGTYQLAAPDALGLDLRGLAASSYLLEQ